MKKGRDWEIYGTTVAAIGTDERKLEYMKNDKILSKEEWDEYSLFLE